MNDFGVDFLGGGHDAGNPTLWRIFDQHFPRNAAMQHQLDPQLRHFGHGGMLAEKKEARKWSGA
jgi:hypothetical protein